jgi:uncharacterized protein YlxP (DUF503 family)
MKVMACLFIVGIMWLAPQAWGFQGDPEPGDAERFGYFLEKNRKKARVPFELHSNLILIYLQVNEFDSLRFILDTGVSATIVTDPAALDTTKLNMTRKINLSGIGEGKAVVGKIAIGNIVRIGSVRGNFQNIIVLQQDLLMLSEYIGVPVHGIIGSDLLSNFVVTIDFVRHELVFTNHINYTYTPRKGTRLPIEIINSKPFISSVHLLEGNLEREIKVLIDTGAGHALLLTTDPEHPFKLPDKLLRSQLGWGLGGMINGSLGRIPEVKIGDFVLKDLLASFPDHASFAFKLDSSANRQGNIGCELLRRFKVTLNYNERYMVLKRVRSRFREKFEHDMSGMDIKADVKDFRSFTVVHVNKNSPAEEAGVQEGDQLIFINESPASEFNVSGIYKLFQTGDGKKIQLLVRRDGNIFFAILTLRRMI